MRTALPMVALTLALVAASMAACSEGGASNGPEWQRARSAYDAAMAEGGVGYLGPRWDETLALLRAVPPDAKADHRRARALVEEIERTRAAAAAQLQKGAADAEKLLDIPVSEPLPIAPVASDAGPPAPPPLPPAPEGLTCRNACASSTIACLEAAGCRREGDRITCEGGVEMQKASNACRDQKIACDAACPSPSGR